MNGAVSKVNKKFISHLTRAKRTPLAAATVPVSYVLITILQCVHPWSHDTHPHGNQIHPRTQKAFSCCDAILETGPAASMRSELLVAHERLGQLPLLTVYVVPM